ncbi:putative cytochrome P450 oxidoreductase OrdA-like protein [Hypoxylon cercidicola]|nr:putative cytochrome P450 oxidoreductase OrdA-like protein [Hypoxylon cercidicola]
MDASSLFICVGIGVTIIYVTSRALGLSKNAGRPPLPPGPKGLPLVGGFNDLPEPGVVESEHWLKHKKLYGPLSSLTTMGQTIVVLNDAKIARELLDKRSAIYSSRPKQVFAGEIIGWENSLTTSPYNSRFRMYRKNIGRIIGSKVTASQFDKLQEAEVGHFLLHVLDSPECLREHIKKETGTVISKITYGYTAESHRDDPFIDLGSSASDHFSLAGVPGSFIVDILPFLKYLPEWLPGAGFKKLGRQWAAELTRVTETPYAFVKHQMSQGKDRGSFLAQLLEAGDTDPEEQHTNKYSAISLYAGGIDTTVSSLRWFFVAMMIYPEVQRRAQQEIDSAVGRDRLPDFADRENLPYIDAVLKEVLRWNPVTPMGIPHASTKDDVFKGYFIPKDSTLLTNLWHFTHDPEIYRDPTVFKPERYLAQNGSEPEPDPHGLVFGFGRRICPGQVLADKTLYLNIAQVLAVFNISKHVENGREIEPSLHLEPGVISQPMPYKCLIKPRSPHHEKLIRSIEDRFPWEESDSKVLESISSQM